MRPPLDRPGVAQLRHDLGRHTTRRHLVVRVEQPVGCQDLVETDAAALFEASPHVQIEKLRRKDCGFVRTVDGVTDGSLVRLIWDEGLKVAGDGALSLIRAARVGCHSCFTKSVPMLLEKKDRDTIGHTRPDENTNVRTCSDVPEIHLVGVLVFFMTASSS